VDIELEDRVIELQQRIDEKLLDLFPDNQEFKSHITLGRIKSIKNTKKFIELIYNIEKGRTQRQNIEVSNLKIDPNGLISAAYHPLENKFEIAANAIDPRDERRQAEIIESIENQVRIEAVDL